MIPVIDDIGDGGGDVVACSFPSSHLYPLGPYRQANTAVWTKVRCRLDKNLLTAGQLDTGRTAFDALHATPDQICLTDELRDELRARMVVDVRGFADLFDFSAIEDRDAIRHRQRLRLVVCHKDDRQLEPPMQVPDVQLHLFAQLLVQRAERLVHQDHFWLEDQGTRQGNPLLLTAREL